jgi:NADPH:quinone reductase-like Zn-dependent oxidoreductase
MGVSMHAESAGTAGSSAVGTVSAVGPNVSNIKVDDKVFVVGKGAWADAVVVDKASVFKIPSLSLEESANLGSLASAWTMLNTHANLGSGDLVLVCNGDSGLNAALTKVGNALGFKVKTVTENEINDAKFADSVKSSGTVKLAIFGKSGKYIRHVFKVMANGGTAVVYNGSLERTFDMEGVEVPMGAAIFNNISVAGFDLQTSAKDTTAFQKAITETSNLISSKKISLDSKSFPWSDFQVAVDATKTAGVPSVLKF